jgi:hypothetical protein
MKKTISFFCLGAQKSGTTTLHDILKQHPDVILPKYKESHFFSQKNIYKKGLHHYFSFYFPQIQDEKIFGEVDPEYLSCKDSPERIKEAFGTSMKFIIILRNPIDRAYSSYLMAKSKGYEELSFEKALENESERLNTDFGKSHFSYSSGSLYSSQIQSYFNIFPKKEFHIIKFEDFTLNIKESISNISLFLNLKPFDFKFQKASNVANEPKSEFIRDFIYKPLWFKKIGHVFFPSQALRSKLMHNLNKVNLKPISNKEELSNEDREKIYTKFFKDEIDKLEVLINKDLSNWKY